jgi:PAS domain S-box-containing protein
VPAYTQDPRTVLTHSPDGSGETLLRASILDAVGEAVVATDLQGHILYWNSAATDLYGWEAEDVLGSVVTDVLGDAGTAREAAATLNRLRRDGSWCGDFLVRHRDGRMFPVQVTANLVRGGTGGRAGGFAGVVGVSRDISSQRAAEATARDAEERLAMVHRAASSVIWEWDVFSGALRLNAAMEDVFGYSEGQVEPTMEWWRSRIHPDDFMRVTESMNRFLAEGRRFWTEEYRFRTADHGYATVFDRAYVAHDDDGVPVRVVGTLVDLTERRRVHEEQRFLSQASMILDLSLDYESTLPTIARLAVNIVADACLVGVVAGEGFPSFVTAAHADPRQQPLMEEVSGYLGAGPPPGPLLERVVRGGESILVPRVPEEAARTLAADSRFAELIGELSPRSAMFVPLSARGSVVGYAIMVSASADRIYGEGDLRTAEELGRRVGATVDHARLFQSAQLANRAKSDFLAVISHELRTPLTAVLGYADLLTEEVAGSLNEAQHRQVGRIRAGSDRLLRLIEGILAFARLETGREQAQFHHVDVRALLRHAEDMVRPSAMEKSVGFQLRIEQVPERLRTDPERFTQVLLSLFTNAVKFTNHGGVDILASTADGSLCIDVTDTGHGIAPEHLPHIFNPFWQAEQPATRRAGGAGLGLSIAQRLARLLDGDVVVMSSSPTGTTFRFRLPIRTEA